MNRVVLSAQLLERGVVRYTPAGLAACDFSLKHESMMTEAGQSRRVALEVRCVVFGELTQRLVRLEMGSTGAFSGFLSAQRNGRGVVLHVTDFE